MWYMGVKYRKKKNYLVCNPPSGETNANYNWPYEEVYYSDKIRKILIYNGWCDKLIVDTTTCSPSFNENPPTYLPD